MTSILLNDPQRLVFALVPERGPVSLMLRVGGPTEVYNALRQIRPELHRLRGDRSNIPTMLSIDESALGELGEDRLVGVLVKALGMVGLTCVGFVADSLAAQAMADAADLMVMPAAPGCSQLDLMTHARAEDEKALRLEEAQAWESALVINAQMDREIEARAWEEALVEDVAFDARKEAERLEALRLKEEEAKDWDQALAYDVQFNREQEARDWDLALAEDRRINAQHELLAWEEALAIEARRQAAIEAARQELLMRLAEEAQAWDEAIAANTARDAAELARDWEEALAEDVLRARAEEAANATRQAVLSGQPIPVSMSVPCPQIAPDLPAPSVASVTRDAVIHERGFEDEDGDVATLAPAVTEQDVAVVPSAHIHRDRVRSGCQVYAKGSDLMVFGNVSSGAEIIADGSINAYAPVYGRIIAGAKGNKQAHVVCQHFFAEIVSIGGGFITSDELPDDLRGTAVHFWHEGDGIHFRRLPAASVPVMPL